MDGLRCSLSDDRAPTAGSPQEFKNQTGEREVEMQADLAGCLPAQKHSGENIGETETHVIFIELKG
jgi:hypothetical protein